ncbi:uncharacterized protein LOC141712968 isoform X2 [Apium graveolens]|uniref:uncharacterized protein LOC141712968 isoform X2 n=1 Tax=Apium graveolens TaxID=4045 RepID=UPI003D7BCE0C
MGSTFNPQILREKLAKLNSSQQSIETLSHWCIFHMNNAKSVVETWESQFHSSPREQRLAFLYLSNDILQNSRRKGAEFVGEFWKVLPNALRDVIEAGQEFEKNAALRLINIWEERKVFGSRGQLLREELVGKKLDTNNKLRNSSGFKLRNSAGNVLDKIVSGYQTVYGSQLDEDVILSKCRNAVTCVQKVEKETGGGIESGIIEEIKEQHTILNDCIVQLMTMQSSRENLISHLRRALEEQEIKLGHVRNQIQAAQSLSTLAGGLCGQFVNRSTVQSPADQGEETLTSKEKQSYMTGNEEQTAPVMYTRQVTPAEMPNHFEDPKSAAAAVAAKLTASTSSAQMLSYVLSTLASESGVNSAMNESSDDCPPEKRTKIENHGAYIPSQNTQPLFLHPNAMQHNNLNASKESSTPEEKPPLPSSPPPMPPLPPPMQSYPVPPFMQNSGSMPSVPYGYGVSQQQPPPFSPFLATGAQFNVIPPFPAPSADSYLTYQTEAGYYGQQSSFAMAPISRQ